MVIDSCFENMNDIDELLKQLPISSDVINIILEYSDEVKRNQMDNHKKLIKLFKCSYDIYTNIIFHPIKFYLAKRFVKYSKIAWLVRSLDYEYCPICNIRCFIMCYNIRKNGHILRTHYIRENGCIECFEETQQKRDNLLQDVIFRLN